MPLDLKYYTDEARHQAHKAARWTGGAALRGMVNFIGGGGAATLGVRAASGGASITMGAVGLLSIGVSSGISAFLQYKEYQHDQHQLLRYYRNEIAAKLSKSRTDVTLEDMQAVAAFNPTLEAEMRRNKREMYLGTAVSLISTITAYSAVFAAFSAFAIPAYLTALAGFGIAVSASYVASKILEPIAAKVFGMDKKTPIDRVRGLEFSQQRGRRISQEQVMAVYVAASPDLQSMIRKDFGHSFDNLSLVRQHEAVLRYGPTLGLEQVTEAINENRMSVRELAFRIHGDTSGAYPEPTLHQQVQRRLGGIKQRISNGREAAGEKWNAFTTGITEKSQNLVSSGKNWVQSLRLKPSAAQGEDGPGWREQITAEREAGSIIPAGPTVH